MKDRAKGVFVLSVLLLLGVVNSSWGMDVIYVKVGASGGGTSWADAMDLQTALGAAVYGDEIWVAAGEYTPGSNRTDSFVLVNGVAVYGGFSGSGDPGWGDRDWVMNLTMLSGDLNDNGQDNSDAYHVVYASAVDPNAILDGFTITDGYANSSDENQQGAGMFNINGAPTISNCIFINNSASYAGGGIYNGIRFNSSLVITEIGTDSPDYVEIQNVISAGVDTTGWMVIVNDASGGINTVHSVSWSLPSSVAAGQVLYRTDDPGDNYWGSNIYWDTTDPGWAMIVDDEGNIVDFMVWGYYESEIASLNIDYGSFTNISIGSAWSGDGSTVNDSANKSFQRVGTKDHDNAADFVITSPQSKGIHNNNLTLPFLDGGPSDPTISNCAFTGNTAYSGGGIYNDSGSPTVTDCTFSGNTAGTNGGGMYNYKSSPTLTNCIFWGDSGGEVYNSGGSDPNITYSDVQGGTGQSWFGTGCIDKDPNFIAEDNLSLNPGSPCIDIGSNAAVPAEITADLDGNPRIIDGDCDGEKTVDMGAYEFNYAYMGDLDYNCGVNFFDFSLLGSAWRTKPPDAQWNHLYDISNPADNFINWRDVAILCDNWLIQIP